MSGRAVHRSNERSRCASVDQPSAQPVAPGGEKRVLGEASEEVAPAIASFPPHGESSTVASSVMQRTVCSTCSPTRRTAQRCRLSGREAQRGASLGAIALWKRAILSEPAVSERRGKPNPGPPQIYLVGLKVRERDFPRPCPHHDNHTAVGGFVGPFGRPLPRPKIKLSSRPDSKSQENTPEEAPSCAALRRTGQQGGMGGAARTRRKNFPLQLVT